MESTGCNKFAKYIVIIISFLFWLAGLSALAIFIWVLTDPSFLLSITQDENHFYAGLYIFLALGLIILIIAFFGCCGSLKESRCMLVSFFCCLLIILVAQIAAGAWAYHNKNKLDDIILSSVKNTVQNEYGVIDTKTAAFDTLQRHFECCGANGPNDWATSKFNNADKSNTFNMEISSQNIMYQIPESCCKAEVSNEICAISRKLRIASLLKSEINTEGCMDKLVAALHENLTTILSIIIVIIAIEFFGLIFSIILCCTIKNEHYKA